LDNNLHEVWSDEMIISFLFGHLYSFFLHNY
jgi:hypothetical protein